MNEEENNENVPRNQKYAYLKDKLNEISEGAQLLTGKDGMVELDSKNPHHVQWFMDK